MPTPEPDWEALLGLDTLPETNSGASIHDRDARFLRAAQPCDAGYQIQPEIASLPDEYSALLGDVLGALDRPLSVTVFPDRFAKRRKLERKSLRQLVKPISTHTVELKDGLFLLKLASFGDVPTFKGCLRHDANVTAIDGVEVEHDAETMGVDEVMARLRSARVAGLVYTSPSHTADKPRWRVLAPTSETLPTDRRQALVDRLNGILGGVLAGESWTLSQSYYFGRLASAADHRVELVDGRPIDLADDVASLPKSNTGSGDKSRSGRALKLAGECRREGLSEAEFLAALARDTELAKWADGKVGERQARRAWLQSLSSAPVDVDAPGKFHEEPEDASAASRDIPETIGGFALNEDGVALLFAKKFADSLRFCHSTGAWYEWRGTHWQREETQLAFAWARDTCRKRAREEPLSAAGKAMAKAASAAAVERYARADRAFAVTADAFDRDIWLLGTPGGTVDLMTGALRLAAPGDMITRQTAAAPISLERFDAARDCPQWLQFLDNALGGDAAAVRFLQQWAGYSLTGDTREEALLFVYGPGGSGKSTAINTLADAMGDYALNVETETLTASKFERHSTDLARLKGARMARASETEAGKAWAESRIKALTGGDVVTARFMRQDNFEFRPEFKLTIVGNHAPAIVNVDEAMRRRFNVLPFTRPPLAPDSSLKDRLKAEQPGILAWAIQGCLDWQRNGLVRPQVLLDATAAYFAQQDTFAMWLDEECEMTRDAAETSDALWGRWDSFCMRAGEKPGSKTKEFPERLKSKGLVPIRDRAGLRGRGFQGIRLKPLQAFDDEDAGDNL